MSDDMIALSRRVVACRGWRWMPGMRAVGKYPDYPVRIHDFGENVQDTDDMLAADKGLPWQQPTEYSDHIYEGPYLPDLTDPATLGCLLAIVREAWGDPSLSLCPWQGGWEFVWAGHGAVGPCGFWPTEADALVAALESAP